MATFFNNEHLAVLNKAEDRAFWTYEYLGKAIDEMFFAKDKAGNYIRHFDRTAYIPMAEAYADAWDRYVQINHIRTRILGFNTTARLTYYDRYWRRQWNEYKAFRRSLT